MMYDFDRAERGLIVKALEVFNVEIARHEDKIIIYRILSKFRKVKE